MLKFFLLKPAPFCKLFTGLGSTNKSATSLLSDSRFVLATLFSPPSFLLSQSLAGTVFSFCFIRLQWIPGHSFLPGNDAADELARRGAPLMLFAIPYSILPLVSTLLFSRTGGALSRRNSSTLRFPRSPLRNLCSLVKLAVFSIVYAATDTAFC